MGKAELPLHAPGTQVDKGYIGQSVPRPNAQRLLQGRGAFIDDLRFPRLAHVAFFRSPYAHAKISKLDFAKALQAARRHRRVRRPRGRRVLHAVGRGARAPEGHQVAAAARDRHRARLLAGRSRARRWSPSRARRPRTRCSSIEAEWEELPVVVDMEESLAGKRVIHPELGDNICFKRELDTGGVDEAFAQGRRGRRGDLPLRPPHRRLPRGPRDPRRLQRRRARADRVPLDAGAAHDAGHLLAAPRHPRRRTCA